jgi:hypothetical protein
MSSDPGQTHFVGDGCQPAHDPRIDQTPPDVWPHPTYIELERQVEQLQSALAVSEQQTADAEELWRADVKRLSEEVQRLRAALQQIKEEGGKVCAEFEVCRHVACQSSVAAWMIADAALGRAKASNV